MDLKKVASSILIGGILIAPGAFAKYQRIPNHPRVNQVNRRYNHLGNVARKDDLTKGQMNRLKKQGQNFREELQTMRKADNGHLTKADQKALNQQLTKGRQEINRMDERDENKSGNTSK